MATSKREYAATDAQPVVLYGLRTPSNFNAVPILATSSGTLVVSSGFDIPAYDFISLSPPSSPTTVIYKTGGSSGTTVATVVITYTGTDIATVTRT